MVFFPAAPVSDLIGGEWRASGATQTVPVYNPSRGETIVQTRLCDAAAFPVWSNTPLGVGFGITPFNFPAIVPLWMHPVAIGCGNTSVLKPGEKVLSPPCASRSLSEKPACPPAC